MAGGWAGSNRRRRLPANWAAIRQQVIERDGGQCTATLDDGTRCTNRGSEVDHIRAMTDDHTLAALQLLCRWHHYRKSSREGNMSNRVRVRERRDAEPHPGIVR